MFFIIAFLLLFFFQLNSTVLSQEIENDINDLESLECFLDGIITSQLDSYHIPGATLAVVKAGRIVIAKGYGYADLKNREPVKAETTIIRPCSVSKLFVWTGIMQLIEKGMLELDMDVNHYLKEFQIPETYENPITLRHLMTHTSGFEDEAIGVLVESENDILPLGDYLAKNIPARVYPPGKVITYSNYGSSLAAYIIETVSGLPFEEYIHKYIFEPLGMNNSTFSQPLPLEFKDNNSVGYIYHNGIYQEGNFEVLQSYPAGSLGSTAVDMARFMIANLNYGKYQDKKILNKDTIREMHSQQFTMDPRLTGWTYGFTEYKINNKRVIGHGGDTKLFHSGLYLIPQEDIGIFISYNGIEGGMARVNFITTFFDRYFPSPEIKLEPADQYEQMTRKYAGSYMFSRSNHSTLEKLNSIFSRANISFTKEGILHFDRNVISEWIEVEPGIFQKTDSNELLVFGNGKDDTVKYAYLDNSPSGIYIKLSWYENSNLHLAILISSILLFVLILIKGIKRFWNIRKARENKYPKLIQRLLYRLIFSVSILNLLFVVGMLLVISYIAAKPYGIPLIVKILLFVPILTLILAPVLLFLIILSWKNKLVPTSRRIFYTVYLLFLVLYISVLHYWNLLGFKF